MHPSAINATVDLAHVEGVFEIVEVAHLQVAVDLVKLLQPQDHVLDFLAWPTRSTADRQLASDDKLADHR